MKRLLSFAALALAVLVSSARAQSPDDQYVRIYSLMQQADTLNKSDQPAAALAKYLEAQTALQKLQKGYPDWNAKVVNFRLNYLAARISAVEAKVPAPDVTAAPAAPGAPAPAAPAKPAGPSDLERQLATLRDDVRQLQADKVLLEMKLKEALATQPAAVDPRELAKAQEKIQSLLRENELLKTTPAAEPAKPAAVADPKALAEAQAALADANRKLNEQAERAKALAAEKQALQSRLDSLVPGAENAAQVERIKQARGEAERELAKAQEKIQSLLRENELLKTTPAAEPAKPAAVADPKALAEAQAALADASRKLNEQAERAKALAAEKQALQSRLDSLVPGVENAAQVERIKQARDEAERKLADQTNLAAKLAAEKETLQARIKTLTPGAEAAEALRAENQILKGQLAEAKSSAGKSGDLSRQLAEAQARVATLQSDAEILRLEKVALEDRIKTLDARTVTSTVIPPAERAEDLRRIKLLEAERSDLAQRLAAANKELYGRKGKAVAARVEELTGQINALRARLDIYEARAVPYTAEELALFKPRQPALAAADPNAGKKSLKELPSGSALLVAEAEREFAARRFDKAEEKYLEVLRQDEKNTFTLANLAAVQLELNRLDEADKHIQKALAIDPNDAYGLSILGYLRFRQEKYDEALDALSRSAKFNPQSAEVQNYLGVALGHKGLRGPAETALRRAIQLDPGYGEAHNNLAVLYTTQQPPLVELARWHYQRALGAGHPRNAELEKVLEQKAPAGAPQ